MGRPWRQKKRFRQRGRLTPSPDLQKARWTEDCQASRSDNRTQPSCAKSMGARSMHEQRERAGRACLSRRNEPHKGKAGRGQQIDRRARTNQRHVSDLSIRIIPFEPSIPSFCHPPPPPLRMLGVLVRYSSLDVDSVARLPQRLSPQVLLYTHPPMTLEDWPQRRGESQARVDSLGLSGSGEKAAEGGPFISRRRPA